MNLKLSTLLKWWSGGWGLLKLSNPLKLVLKSSADQRIEIPLPSDGLGENGRQSVGWWVQKSAEYISGPQKLSDWIERGEELRGRKTKIDGPTSGTQRKIDGSGSFFSRLKRLTHNSIFSCSSESNAYSNGWRSNHRAFKWWLDELEQLAQSMNL